MRRSKPCRTTCGTCHGTSPSWSRSPPEAGARGAGALPGSSASIAATSPSQPTNSLAARARAGFGERLAELERDGYPAYITSAGWIGYDDDGGRARVRSAQAEGLRHFKLKVGGDPDHEHAGAHGHIVGPTLVPDCLVTHDPDPDHAAIARSQRLSEVTVRKRGSHGLDVLREGARRSR